MENTRLEKFVKENLTSESKYSDLQVGTEVEWTNDYGVKWQNKIIGFDYTSDRAVRYGATVHLNTGAFWFGHNPAELTVINK